MYLSQFLLIYIFIFYKISYVWSGAIQINSKNIDSILSSNKIVFINFYANWCRFSQMLNPIYDQLANKINKEYPEKNLIVIGKVDCDSDQSIAVKYNVNKYPTLKLYRHGLMTKREYRGARQVDAFYDYLRKQIESSIINLTNPNDLIKLDSKKRTIIGYFDNDQSNNYQIFSKIANLLRDDCQFAASTNKNEFEKERSINDTIYYTLNNKTEYYSNLLNNEQLLYMWLNEKCIPLVREITFENAEELTDEGLPFLILFHHIDDHQIFSIFQEQVSKQLLHYKSTINCLHADGNKFTHPLKHLGKTIKDLPLLVIDTFKHMFLFPNIQQLSEEGKLLEFVKDLHSGKLHKDFHNPQKQINKNEHDVSSPPESVFVRLTPSRQRYSFRDEL